MIRLKKKQCQLCHKEIGYQYTCNCKSKRGQLGNNISLKQQLNKQYQLLQLAQQFDKIKQQQQKMNLSNSNCTLSKELILKLLKDRCLLCKKMCYTSYQRYQLLNGFCICNDCQILINNRDQKIQNYIKPLLFECMNCQYDKIKRTKEQMHVSQNKNQLPVCKTCYQNNFDRLIKLQERKQKQQKRAKQQQDKKRQQENQRKIQLKKRQEQNAIKQKQSQIRRIQIERKTQQIKTNKQMLREKVQQIYFKKQLKMIKEMEQIQKLQKQLNYISQQRIDQNQNRKNINLLSQKDNIIKSKQIKLSQEISSQQTFKKQQQKDDNKSDKLTCGLCFQFIDTLQKLGVKNQDGLNLCKTCYQNQKTIIQSKSSHLLRSSENQNSVQISQQNQQAIKNVQSFLYYSNNKNASHSQNFDPEQRSNKISSINQSQMPNNTNILVNRFQHTLLNPLQKQKQLVDDDSNKESNSSRQKEFQYSKNSINLYLNKREYPIILTPQLQSDSVFYEMNSFSLPQILIKHNQQEKLTTMSKIRNQQTKMIKHQFKKRQQPVLNLSFHSNDMKPQRDNSGSFQNQNIHKIYEKNIISSHVPFNAGQSQIPKKPNKFLNDEFQEQNSNPLQTTQMQIHNMLAESQQKKQHSFVARQLSIKKIKLKNLANENQNN